MNNRSGQKGFTLVVSIVIISTVLLVFAVVAARGVREQQLFSISILSSIQARSLSESCMEVALLKKGADEAYLGSETIVFNGESCDILPISSSQILTEANVDGHVYRLRADFTQATPVDVSSWRRVSEF